MLCLAELMSVFFFKVFWINNMKRGMGDFWPLKKYILPSFPVLLSFIQGDAQCFSLTRFIPKHFLNTFFFFPPKKVIPLMSARPVCPFA